MSDPPSKLLAGETTDVWAERLYVAGFEAALAAVLSDKTVQVAGATGCVSDLHARRVLAAACESVREEGKP